MARRQHLSQSVWGFRLSLSGATHLSAGWQGLCCAILGRRVSPLRVETNMWRSPRHWSKIRSVWSTCGLLSDNRLLRHRSLTPLTMPKRLKGRFGRCGDKGVVRKLEKQARIEQNFLNNYVFPPPIQYHSAARCWKSRTSLSSLSSLRFAQRRRAISTRVIICNDDILMP